MYLGIQLQYHNGQTVPLKAMSVKCVNKNNSTSLHLNKNSGDLMQGHDD